MARLGLAILDVLTKADCLAFWHWASTNADLVLEMPIPDYQTCMLHLLRLTSEGAEHTLKDAVRALADVFQLADGERTEILPSGQQAIFNNRVAWAKTYLNKAGTLEAPRRGVFTIAEYS